MSISGFTQVITDAYYPSLQQLQPLMRIGDRFNRLTLNPSGEVVYYISATSDGSTAILSGGELRCRANSGTNTYASAALTELNFDNGRLLGSVLAGNFPKLTQTELNFIFRRTGTNAEGFLGMHVSASALTAVPTTASHFGLWWDKSASDNYFFTSAVGAAQTSTDTTIAFDTANRRLRLLWTSGTKVLMQLIDATGTVNSEITATITDNSAYYLHVISECESAADTCNIQLSEWHARGY